MAEQRFTRLNEVTQTKWVIGCPVEIEKGAILLDTETQKIILQLKLRNVSDQGLKFVSIKIYRYDMADDFIAEKDDPIKFAYPDTNIPVTNTFGDKVPINLGINSTRKVKIIFDKIVYSNDEVWRNPDDSDGIEFERNLISETFEPKLVEQFNKEYCKVKESSDITKYDYMPFEMEEYWICTCGFANQKVNEKCGRCKLDKASLFKLIKEDYLLDRFEQDTLEAKERLYKEAIEVKSVALNEKDYKKANSFFLRLSGYKDADKLATECEKLAEFEFIEKEKTDAKNLRINEEKKQKEKIENEKKQRKIKRTIVFGSLIAAIVIVFISVILPSIKYNIAIEYFNNKQYQEAVTAFEKLGDYKDSKIKINEVKYAEAVQLLDKKQYSEAVSMFAELGDYKDSKIKINEVKYAEAMQLLDKKQYSEAVSMFAELGDYKDNKIKINEVKYAEAMQLLDEKQYSEAVSMFAELGDYKDSKTQLQKYNKQLINNAKAGDKIFYGNYEQDNNISNGKEPIEWRVLSTENGRALLISEKNLDCKQYNETDTSITWEKSTIRAWLNGEFISAAFSSAEKASITESSIENNNNAVYGTDAGSRTTDRIFLLSIDEANKYFRSDNDRIAKSTAYAKAQGAYDFYSGTGWWWLRSPSNMGVINAVYVDCNGDVCESGNSVINGASAVRPAFYINLGS